MWKDDGPARGFRSARISRKRQEALSLSQHSSQYGYPQHLLSRLQISHAHTRRGSSESASTKPQVSRTTAAAKSVSKAPQELIVGYRYVEVHKITAESRPSRPLRIVRPRAARFASEALRCRPQAQPQNAVLLYFLNKYPLDSENMDSGLELWPKSVKTTAPCHLTTWLLWYMSANF